MPIGSITPGSPVVVTPDISPLTRLASMTAPTATMAVSAAHIQALTLALLNLQELFGHGRLADMENATNVEEGSLFFVYGLGFFYATFTSSSVADGKTIVDSLAVAGAKWFYEGISLSNGGHPRIAWTGPIPGTSLPVGRIDPTIENYQTIFFNVHANAIANNTRPFADPTTSGDDLTGDALGAIQVGDVIRGRIPVAANCSSHFRMGVYVTQDNGATYELVSPFASATLSPTFSPPASGDRVGLDMSFVYVVKASPAPSFAGWSLRGQGNGNVLTANLGSILVEVIRP